MIKIVTLLGQSPVRFNVLMLFLKTVYVLIFLVSSGIEFHIFDAVYLHDLKP